MTNIPISKSLVINVLRNLSVTIYLIDVFKYLACVIFLGVGVTKVLHNLNDVNISEGPPLINSLTQST